MIDGNQFEHRAKYDRYATAGSFALGLGTLLVLARVFEASFGIPGLPRSWYQNDWLWWSIGLVNIGLGSWLLLKSELLDRPERGWRPSQPGQRFRELILYTREGCHLCEDAADTLEKHRPWLPAVVLIDIDTDPQLVTKFGTCVPVLVADGKIRFRGKVNETLLRRLIEGTPSA
jgi:glutaredoxin